jgi:hypothetical protein
VIEHLISEQRTSRFPISSESNDGPSRAVVNASWDEPATNRMGTQLTTAMIADKVQSFPILLFDFHILHS